MERLWLDTVGAPTSSLQQNQPDRNLESKFSQAHVKVILYRTQFLRCPAFGLQAAHSEDAVLLARGQKMDIFSWT